MNHQLSGDADLIRKAGTKSSSKTSATKAKPRNIKKKSDGISEEKSPKSQKPKSKGKAKGKKRNALLNKSIYRYHFQRTKPKLRRLLEANELLKDELKRKQREMTVLCGDIHHLLERLKPYVSTNDNSSSDSDTDSTLNSIKQNSKIGTDGPKPKKGEQKKRKINVKQSPKSTIHAKKGTKGQAKTNSTATDTISSVSVAHDMYSSSSDPSDKLNKERTLCKKSSSPVCADIAQFIAHQSQQILDDFMMLESPYSIFNLKRNEAFDVINDHEPCNGSLNVMPMLKESMDDNSSLGRRGSLELSSETSSGDSLVASQSNTTFLKQMKSQLSFFLPSEMDHQLVSMNPDKLPPTLPDDIFSES